MTIRLAIPTNLTSRHETDRNTLEARHKRIGCVGLSLDTTKINNHGNNKRTIIGHYAKRTGEDGYFSAVSQQIHGEIWYQ